MQLPVSHQAGQESVTAADGTSDAVVLANGAGLPEQLGAVRNCLDAISGDALGSMMTALAALLCAPFWFDTLNRVVSIRATGKPPEEKPTAPKAVSAPVEPGQSPQEADRLKHGGTPGGSA